MERITKNLKKKIESHISPRRLALSINQRINTLKDVLATFTKKSVWKIQISSQIIQSVQDQSRKKLNMRAWWSKNTALLLSVRRDLD